MPDTLRMNGPHTWIGAAVAGNQGETAEATGEEVVRSEEQLQVGTQNVVVGRVRLVKYLVTEHQTFTVPVRREEVRLEYEPVSEHEQTITATAPAEEIYEVLRCEEQVVITTRAVPVERVRMIRRVATTEQIVRGEVRAERIDLDKPDTRQSEPRQPREQQQPGEMRWD